MYIYIYIYIQTNPSQLMVEKIQFSDILFTISM